MSLFIAPVLFCEADFMLSHVKLPYSWYTEGENSSDQGKGSLDLFVPSQTRRAHCACWSLHNEPSRVGLGRVQEISF